MSDPTYPLFSIFAFLGFIISLIPFPWHLQAWNSGTCYFMIWTSISCLNQFINSVVWAGNALNPAPWWCEISIRILMGASVGIPASSLCIVRRLYKISKVQAVTVSLSEKRRAIIIDSLICVLFPLIYIALQYIVQGHRFNIFEDIGCYPALFNTLPTYFISLMWPVLIGLVSATYCALALREFNKRRIQFNQFLHSNGSLTLSRYVRLMTLAMVEMLCTTPLAVFIIYLNATASEIDPWISWADTHFDYSRIEQIPAVLWRSNHQVVVSMELTRWLSPVCAIVFFIFFGFAQEAKKNYSLVYLAIAKHLRFLPLPALRSSAKSSLPTHHAFAVKGGKDSASGMLPLHSPQIEKSTSNYPTSSHYSAFSDNASATDVSSKYENKIPFTPTTPFSPVSITESCDSKSTATLSPETPTEDGWNPSSNIALTTFSVSLPPSDPISRRLTM